jgi:hypothetical protein
MGVLKKDRGLSSVQFIDTARALEVLTLKNCLKFPKRYTFFITTEIVRLSQSVYNNVKSANSIYPTNQIEAQMRRDYFTKANCDLQALISQLGIAKEIITTEMKATIWIEWMNLIEEEAKLISAVKKNDKERFKSLP